MQRNLIDLTPLLQAVIILLASLITYRFIPWLKVHTSESKFNTLYSVTYSLVYAADKLYKTGILTDKLKFVEDQLIERGYKIDRALIESCVTDLDIAQSIVPVIEAEEPKKEE